VTDKMIIMIVRKRTITISYITSAKRFCQSNTKTLPVIFVITTTTLFPYGAGSCVNSKMRIVFITFRLCSIFLSFDVHDKNKRSQNIISRLKTFFYEAKSTILTKCICDDCWRSCTPPPPPRSLFLIFPA